MQRRIPDRLTGTLLALSVALAAASGVTAADSDPGTAADGASGREQAMLAPVPATPAGIEGVLYARAFRLAEPVRYAWSADVGEIRSGTILVLEVDPAYLQPRALAEPVLYVGEHPAWRVSHGTASGRVVAIVPGEIDLSEAPVFFGSPALPEAVDGQRARAELDRARAAGIRSVSADVARSARAAGGRDARLGGRQDLLQTTAALIDRYVSR